MQYIMWLEKQVMKQGHRSRLTVTFEHGCLRFQFTWTSLHDVQHIHHKTLFFQGFLE